MTCGGGLHTKMTTPMVMTLYSQMKKDALLLHLQETLDAKMEMGLPNFGLGGIAPPTLIEEDMEFMAAWRGTLKATSERLTAMATEKIQMELEKTKREILLMKN